MSRRWWWHGGAGTNNFLLLFSSLLSFFFFSSTLFNAEKERKECRSRSLPGLSLPFSSLQTLSAQSQMNFYFLPCWGIESEQRTLFDFCVLPLPFPPSTTVLSTMFPFPSFFDIPLLCFPLLSTLEQLTVLSGPGLYAACCCCSD